LKTVRKGQATKGKTTIVGIIRYLAGCQKELMISEGFF
jgi:hypothetical protein